MTPRTGDPIGPLALDVTYERCVQCVAATRDFNPLHYDRDAARAAGAPDVFLNTMTYQGLFGRLLQQWAGPDARLRALRVEMGAPAIPGDRLSIAGTVTESDGVRVSADVWIDTERAGRVTTGRAVVELGGAR